MSRCFTDGHLRGPEWGYIKLVLPNQGLQLCALMDDRGGPFRGGVFCVDSDTRFDSEDGVLPSTLIVFYTAKSLTLHTQRHAGSRLPETPPGPRLLI